MTLPTELPSPEDMANMNLAELREAHRIAVDATVDTLSHIVLLVSGMHTHRITTTKHLENVYNGMQASIEVLLTLLYATLEISLATYQESYRMLDRIKKEGYPNG